MKKLLMGALIASTALIASDLQQGLEAAQAEERSGNSKKAAELAQGQAVRILQNINKGSLCVLNQFNQIFTQQTLDSIPVSVNQTDLNNALLSLSKAYETNNNDSDINTAILNLRSYLPSLKDKDVCWNALKSIIQSSPVNYNVNIATNQNIDSLKSNINMKVYPHGANIYPIIYYAVIFGQPLMLQLTLAYGGPNQTVTAQALEDYPSIPELIRQILQK